MSAPAQQTALERDTASAIEYAGSAASTDINRQPRLGEMVKLRLVNGRDSDHPMHHRPSTR